MDILSVCVAHDGSDGLSSVERDGEWDRVSREYEGSLGDEWVKLRLPGPYQGGI